ARRGAYHSDLQDRRRPVADRQLWRADIAARRLGHRDPAVPPVLPDDPRRARGGGEDRRRRPVAISDRHRHPFVAHQHLRAVRNPLHLRLEPVFVAASGHEQPVDDDHRAWHSFEVAPEIPVQTEPLEREEALYALIRNCARSGESWVAIDETGRIVGFLLAEPDQARRHYGEHEILELRYAGVVKTHRRRGIFTGLVERVLARLVPVV